MRVLFLPRYTRLGASSRIRAYQYFPYLAEHGVEIEVMPLVDDDYLTHLYEGRGKQWGQIVVAYWQRIRYLLAHQNFDVIWVQKELLPNLPAWFEKLLLRQQIPYVLDYDDATFLNYTQGSPLKRALLSQKIAKLMRGATLVICGNAYLGNYAKQAGAKWVQYLPSVVDATHYPQQAEFKNEIFTIGWVGTPTTAKYVVGIQPVLAEFCGKYPVKIVMVGASQVALGDLPVEFIAWSEATEAQIISTFDVGIMPLADTDWEHGKCGYKLLQYMACGVPTIASNIGINRTIIEHEATGFLVNTSTDWLDALTTLHTDAELRTKMGQAGRTKLMDKFELQVTAPRLLSLLQEASQQRL